MQTKSSAPVAIIGSLLFAAGLSLNAQAQAPSAAPAPTRVQLVDRVVAVVNDEVITR